MDVSSDARYDAFDHEACLNTHTFGLEKSLGMDRNHYLQQS